MPARRITALVVRLIALSAVVALVTTSCHRSGPRKDDPNAFSWNGELTTPATVLVRNTQGSITVEPSADNAMHVVAATSWTRGDPKRDVQFRVVSAATTVTVCAVWNNGECSATNYQSTMGKKGFSWSWRSRSDAEVAFTIQVPTGVKVDAWTMTGPVTVRASAPVKARSITGDIKVGTAVGPVDAETLNGDVDIRMTTLAEAGPVRAVTKNGTAVAWVPDITDGLVQASTLNGEVGTDFGGPAGEQYGRSHDFKATIGAGARKYLVETLNGSAWLRLINADGTVAGAASAGAPVSTAKGSTAVIRPPGSRRNR